MLAQKESISNIFIFLSAIPFPPKGKLIHVRGISFSPKMIWVTNRGWATGHGLIRSSGSGYL